MSREIHAIAKEIRSDWKKVNYGAEPYLEAMQDIRSVDDMYGMDSAKMVIAYFLGNASTWRGEVAKRVKKELNEMIK